MLEYLKPPTIHFTSSHIHSLATSSLCIYLTLVYVVLLLRQSYSTQASQRLYNLLPLGVTARSSPLLFTDSPSQSASCIIAAALIPREGSASCTLVYSIPFSLKLIRHSISLAKCIRPYTPFAYWKANQISDYDFLIEPQCF